MDDTLLDLLEQKVAVNGDKALYSFVDRRLSVRVTLSYTTLYQKAGRVAVALQHADCADKPVLLYCPHGPEFLVAFFACVMAGAWPVPVTRTRAQSETGLTRLLNACSATIMITTASRFANLSDVVVASGLTLLSVDAPPAVDQPYRRPLLSGSDTAFIQYTSGSTSSPKGVVISHANVLHNAEQIRQAFVCTPEDVGVSWLPFHHDMGLIGHVIEPLYAGLHNYFLNPVDFVARPVRWLQAISRFGGTLSGGPDFAFALATEKIAEDQLHDMSLTAWRLAYCGAEKIRPKTLSYFARRFSGCGFNKASFFPCYGLAEATLFVSGQYGVMTHTTNEPEPCNAAVCLGRPAEGTAVLIVNPATGDRVDDGGIGEICVGSASVASCYYRDPTASDKVFGRRDNTELRFCRTGDRGFIRHQRLYLLGRYKNVIKRNGCSFHAEDMEAVLTTSLGGKLIRRCVAFASGDQNTDRIVVLLERSRIRKQATKAAEHHLIVSAGALLTDEFGIVPDDICVLPADTLPLTSSGKIRRHECLQVYRQHTSGAREV